jgi:hypothetical protein
MQASTLQRPHPASADTTHTPMHATRDRPTRAAHAVAPAVACFRPAPHSPAPKSMAHRCHAVTVTVWGLPIYPTISSDSGLPLALLGAPVDIGALVKPGSLSLAKQDRDWQAALPGQDYMYPFS